MEIFKTKTSSVILKIVIFAVVTIFFILDRSLKSWFLFDDKDYFFLGDLLGFSFTANHNIAFSIPLQQQIIFFVIPVILLIVLALIISSFLNKKNKEFIAFLSLFLGALSNYVDRLAHGFVIDYIYFFNISIFNIADILIFSSSFYLIFLYLSPSKK